MDMISGDWTKIDGENKTTEISFSLKDKVIAKITFDLVNEKASVEGDLSKVTNSEDNTEFIKTYQDCSKEILRIL